MLTYMIEIAKLARIWGGEKGRVIEGSSKYSHKMNQEILTDTF